MATATIRLQHPVDLRRTVFPLVRGDGDPTTRIDGPAVWRAIRTPDGAATLRLTQTATSVVEAEAWGPGADHAIEVAAPGLAGALDHPDAFMEPVHPAVATAWREHRNVLLTRAEPFPVLIAAILEQKVTGIEARRAWREIVPRTSDAAPGDVGLFLPPDPERLAAIPGWELTRLGVTGRRAETLRETARHPKKIAALTDASWLAKLPGVGPWTLGEVGRIAFGDPDAISVGDAHLPNIVCWALAGEPRGTDERMLELVEPYRGQRGRVEVLLEVSGITPPAFGPKVEPRSFV
ncbi:MAG TPA: DNA-3-methyladenine glycosylase 2 family protein [Actinomycetota bacterium]|nr:DNA-3-methyladenine glycosylase 2 family protein [Actinomycetota bacterium]